MKQNLENKKRETKKVTYNDYLKVMSEGNKLVNALFGDIMKATERFK